MRRTVLAIGACVCVIGLVVAAMGQPGVTSTAPLTPAPRGLLPPSNTGSITVAWPAEVASGTVTAQAAPAQSGSQGFFIGGPANMPGVTINRIDLNSLRVSELLGKWKAAKSDSDRDNVQKELRTALKEEFKTRAGEHQKEIEQLQAKIKELQEQLKLRRQKENEIVDFRLQQLLREAQGLGWGTETGTGQQQAYGFASGGFGANPMLGQSAASGGPGGGGMTYQFSSNQSSTGGAGFQTGGMGGSRPRQGGFLGVARPPAPGQPVGLRKSISFSSNVGTGGKQESYFEELFKRFDSNGNGILEEEEATPAHGLLEMILKAIGKQPTYPIAISDIVKAIQSFPGRISIRQDNQGSTVIDIQEEPYGPPNAPIAPAPTGNLLPPTLPQGSFQGGFRGVFGNNSTATTAIDEESPTFEAFLKKFDVNGDGMLDADEIANTPAKFLVEGVLSQPGKPVKYPIAISEILKAIEQYSGRVRVRESGGSRGKHTDVELEPVGPANP